MKKEFLMAIFFSFIIHGTGIFAISIMDFHCSEWKKTSRPEILKVSLLNPEEKSDNTIQVLRRDFRVIKEKRSIPIKAHPKAVDIEEDSNHKYVLFEASIGNNEMVIDNKGEDEKRSRNDQEKYRDPSVVNDKPSADSDKLGDPEAYLLEGGKEIGMGKWAFPVIHGGSPFLSDGEIRGKKVSPSSGNLGKGGEEKGGGTNSGSLFSASAHIGPIRSEPKYKINPKPPYPLYARERGFEGVSILLVEVLENGKVGKISLERSSGYKILDEAALKTVKEWQFKPAYEGDRPITMWVRIPIRFELK
jgi:TonB family protein